MQHKDAGPWTHGAVVRNGSDGHHGRSYKIRVSIMGCIITRTSRHTQNFPNQSRRIFEKRGGKGEQIVRADKPDELVEYYANLYEN